MKIRIETERLLIRTPELGDAREVNQAIVESLGELRPYMPWADHTPSLTETRTNLRQAIELAEKDLDVRLHAFCRRTGKFIASSGLHKIEWRIPRAEVGYWVRTSETKKGYALETARGVTDYAFQALKFRRIEIVVSDSNVRSWRIPEKLDFILEGTQRMNRVNPDGTIDSTRLYAKLANA